MDPDINETVGEYAKVAGVGATDIHYCLVEQNGEPICCYEQV